MKTTSSPSVADTCADGSLPGRIGPYRVVRRLATGGTSDVLLAMGEGGRAVVLKLLLQEFRHHAQFEKMFTSEAAAYSRLSHPAIVKLYDFFSDADQLVMVLEYVDGMALHKLRALLRRGKFLDDAAALFVGWRVFGALAAAHAARDPQTGALSPVIHRDVNPSNVLIPWDGQVKIADFGIAKVAGVDSDKTQAGFIKGTYGYMAPEQVRGESVTDRADVYAASLLLWELLVGRKAIVRGGASDLDVLRAMAEPAFPMLSALRPELPLEVLDAVGRGLEADPSRRTISAEELAAALAISCNLQDGRQRLVDALTGVRPPALAEDLAVTVSRSPASPSADASADAPLPDLAGLADDSLSLPPLPPLMRMLPAPAVAPSAPRPPVSQPTPRPPPDRPASRAAEIGAGDGARTLMGVSPGKVPTRASLSPAPSPGPPPPSPLPTVVIARTPFPPQRVAAPAGPQPSPSPVQAAQLTVALAAPPGRPPPLPAQAPGFLVSPLASRSSSPAPLPIVWAPPPPPAPPLRAAPPGLGGASSPRVRSHARAVAGVGGLGALVLLTAIIVWARGQGPMAYDPPERASFPAATAPTVPTSTAASHSWSPPPPPPVAPTPSLAGEATVVAAPTPAVASASGGTAGTITVSDSRGGHRVWVDRHIVGESPGTWVVKCGWRAVQLGSQGQRHNVDVPCGGDLVVRW